jgi:hypothetical protein
MEIRILCPNAGSKSAINDICGENGGGKFVLWKNQRILC